MEALWGGILLEWRMIKSISSDEISEIWIIFVYNIVIAVVKLSECFHKFMETDVLMPVLPNKDYGY